jgi:dipeptidyl aminopeptidase/acylaminoacyl peptidase
MATPETRPYGTWDSPLSAAEAAAAGVDFGHLAVDDGAVYWRERRPDEDGRAAVVRHDGTGTAEVTPDDVDVRTRVHEYGGGDFAVADGVLYYADHDDGRVYRMPADGGAGDEPEPVTPAPETDVGLRYADFEVGRVDGDTVVYAVREDHDAVAAGDAGSSAGDPSGDAGSSAGDPSGDTGSSAGDPSGDTDEPVTALVRLDPEEGEEPAVVAEGHDFYAAPRLSPAGDRLAWLTWDHPNMPWDGTELHVAEVTEPGDLTGERVVMGGPAESVFQPAWSPGGTLHAVSDRTGWWNLYRRTNPDTGAAWAPLREEAAEYGAPQWTFGLATYAFLDDGRVACVVTREGDQQLELLDGDDRSVLDVPFASFGHPQVRADGDAVVTYGKDPCRPDSVLRVRPGATTGADGGGDAPADHDVLDTAGEVPVDPAYLPDAEAVSFPTRDGATAHAYHYPPTNPDFEAPDGDAPPLVTVAHGGPTSQTRPTLDLTTAFFTSRGFAVLDVNYRGSTGYGRAYREALAGEWGIVDVADVVGAAEHLASEGLADPDRLAVRGGSAGGFVTLAALAFHDAFDAGASYYGVADLERLAELTHKFESRYLDGLVGPYPEAADTYRERSPVHHADGISAPVLLLQGAEDPVVPLEQAEAMADALAETGVTHDLVVFDGEEHGFRRADSRERATERELAFYRDVFGLAGD